jgi:hypothetical protein
MGAKSEEMEIHSLFLDYMEMSGELHTPASLPPRTKPLVGWAA